MNKTKRKGLRSASLYMGSWKRYVPGFWVWMFLITPSLRAQDILTLQEAIGIALRNNYDIQLAQNDSLIAALDYEYRNAVFLPRLNANLGTTWTQNNNSQEFSDGTNRSGNVGTNNLSGSLTLNWVLFDGMRMFATRDKAEQMISLGDKVIKNQVVNTVAQVITTYYAIVREKQQLLAIEEQLRFSQARVDLTSRRLEIGAGARPDVLQSQVDHNAQRAARLRQQTLISQLKENLNLLMFPEQTGSGPASTSYEVSEHIPLEPSLALEDILRDMDETNPILDITRKNIDIAHISLREVKADRWPTLQFNSAYNFNRVNNNIALNPFLPLINQNRGFNYGFTATIPILNYRNTHRLIRQAELNINYQSLLYNSQRAQLRLTVVNAFKEYEFQQQALALEEENIGLARENVEIILQTFRLGGATLIQLREAERSLEEANNRLIAARYSTKVAETELMRLRGELVR